MKKNILLVLALFAFVSAGLLAEVPTTLSIQGYLDDGTGNPFEGSAVVTVNLYDSETGLNPAVVVYSPVTVDVLNGYFTVILDQEPALTIFAKDELWYELTITEGSNTTVTGRLPFTAVPYAVTAKWAEEAEKATPTGPAGGHLKGTYPNPEIDEYYIAKVIGDIGPISATPTGPANGDIVGFYPSSLLIKDRAVQSKHLGYGVVLSENIADKAVTTDKIGDEAVTNAKIADNAVSTGKIQNSAITTDKIADLAVTNAKIGTGAVDTRTIADLAVTNAKIADDAISNRNIQDDAV